MAQLVDFSQIFIGSYMTASKFATVDMDVIRPAVLNTLRMYRTKFVSEFGELILCCDDRKTWRKDIFPNYKASRKKTRAATSIDWENLYECLMSSPLSRRRKSFAKCVNKKVLMLRQKFCLRKREES